MEAIVHQSPISNAFFLIGQIASIICIGTLFIFISSLYRKRPHGLWYSFMRYTRYGEKECIQWFAKNPLYMYYLLLCSCLIMTEGGMIQQIADGSVYSQPAILFFSNIGVPISIILVLMEVMKKTAAVDKKRLEDQLLNSKN